MRRPRSITLLLFATIAVAAINGFHRAFTLYLGSVLERAFDVFPTAGFIGVLVDYFIVDVGLVAVAVAVFRPSHQRRRMLTAAYAIVGESTVWRSSSSFETRSGARSGGSRSRSRCARSAFSS